MSNMYNFISKTWNPLAGECSHKCSYCYVNYWKKRSLDCNEKYSHEPRIHIPAMNQALGHNKNIFVCSMNDLFANDVDSAIIKEIIQRMCKFPNRYLLQTKNVIRFFEFTHLLPGNVEFVTTIESDIFHPQMGLAPLPTHRRSNIKDLTPASITIEPIMKFSPNFARRIINTGVLKVNIGADSKNNNLPEPTVDEIHHLILALKNAGIQVHLKENLNRIFS
jgi:DNA repair photolyase